jgi:iron complex transport system permease protein
MMRVRHPYLLNLLVLAAALLLSVAVGAIFIPPRSLIALVFSRLPGLGASGEITAAFEVIFFRIRLPHTALIALTGASLAGSGAAYQGLFRNPLADPYLIGVASGAGLGAVLAMSFQWPEDLGGLISIPAAAFLGAVITVGMVYILARAESGLPTGTLLLAGVAVSSFATALTSYLMLRSQGELRRAIVWLLGGSPMSGWNPVLAALPYMAIGLGLLLLSGHALNVLQFGENQALQLGLSVGRAKLLVIFSASLVAATAVAFSGVIGFIGLIVPHVVRLLWGPDYRLLIPLSILGGASALLVADLLARLILAPQALPVGVITALAGAPFFLWVLRRSKSRPSW